MRKKIEPKERRNLSSGEFTKLFIKNFLLNSIFVGIVLYIVYEVAKEILPTTVTTILNFVLIFVGVIKIYLSAIKESFYEGKIYQADINKIAKNIVLIFVAILLINLVGDYMSYARGIKVAQALGMEKDLNENLIINIIVNIVMYAIIAISCRIKFLKECESQENVI